MIKVEYHIGPIPLGSRTLNDPFERIYLVRGDHPIAPHAYRYAHCVPPDPETPEAVEIVDFQMYRDEHEITTTVVGAAINGPIDVGGSRIPMAKGGGIRRNPFVRIRHVPS